MPRNNFTHLVWKALRFAFARPIQRFNIANRAEKYLGPDAPKFKLSPRAISDNSPQDNPLQIEERRSHQIEAEKKLSEIADKLKVNMRIETKPVQPLPGHSPENRSKLTDTKKTKRPLPVLHNLRFIITDIWDVDRVPYGRLSVKQIDELMLNRLSDDTYWTPKKISENYKLSLDNAIKLNQYVQPMKIYVSPRMAKNLEIVGRDNEMYQRVKDFAIEVDESLRTDIDKHLDSPETNQTADGQKLIDFGPNPRPHIKKLPPSVEMNQKKSINDDEKSKDAMQSDETIKDKPKRVLASTRDKKKLEL